MKISNFKFHPFGKLRTRISNFNNGFTLIELLVAVTIVGVLSALLTTNFIAIRQRARDAQRKADLRQIQSALEIYRADIGDYPASLKNCSSIRLGNPACTATYLQTVPSDPLGSSYYNSGDYYYAKNADGTYTLAACIENNADQDKQIQDGDDFAGDNVTCTSDRYYVLNSP